MDSATKVLLTFRESPTKDECGNTWVTIGNPTIGAANSKFGSALQLDGASGIAMSEGIPLGGADFTIDFWVHFDENSFGRLIDTEPRWFYVERNTADDNSLIVRFDNGYGAFDSDAYIAKEYPFYEDDMDSDTFVDTYINESTINYEILSRSTKIGSSYRYCFWGKDYGIYDYENDVFLGYFYLTEGLKHVAIIYSHANHFLGVFVDGTLENFQQYTCTRANIKFYLGCKSDSTSGQVGTISEFRISDGVARWITDDNNSLIKPVDFDEHATDQDNWFVPPTESYRDPLNAREQANGDTLRRLLPHDVERAAADTLRHINAGRERVDADTCRRLHERATMPTARQLNKRARVIADTALCNPFALYYRLDASGNLQNTLATSEVLSLDILLQERTLSDRFTVQTTGERWQVGSRAKGQLLDYEFSFLVESVNDNRGIRTLTSMYDQDELLYTKIFPTIIVDYETGSAYGKGSAISYLEPQDIYEYSMHGRKVGSAGVYMIQLAKYLGLNIVLHIDDFVSTKDFTARNISYHDLIQGLFSWTSRVPRRMINVFIRGKTLYCIQRGSEQTVFDISDWTHSEPQIERSIVRSLFNNPLPHNNSDDDDDDDDDDPIGEWQEEEIAVPFSGTLNFSDDLIGSTLKHMLKYQDGLIVEESQSTFALYRNKEKSSNSRITYTYEIMNPAGTTDLQIFFHGDELPKSYYLKSKTEKNSTVDETQDPPTKSTTDSVTHYSYSYTDSGDIYLTHEHTRSTTTSYVREKRLISSKTDSSGNTTNEYLIAWFVEEYTETTNQTNHVPLGNGFYATSMYSNGEPKGSSISQGAPGNAITPFTVNQVQKTFHISEPTATPEPTGNPESPSEARMSWRHRLSPIVDTSFPVNDIAMLYSLTDEIYWMNRKTEERIRLNLISEIRNGIPEQTHIIDFTERVLFDGNEYFLESNRIQFTPRRLIQHLQLVRWY